MPETSRSCANTKCARSKIFTPTRDWQRFCCPDCRKEFDRDNRVPLGRATRMVREGLRELGPEAAIALLPTLEPFIRAMVRDEMRKEITRAIRTPRKPRVA